jgi:hypothetical protein
MLHNAADNALNIIVTRRRVCCGSRRFEATYRPHFQGSILRRPSNFEDDNDTFLRNFLIHLAKTHCHIAEDLNPQFHPCRDL